MSDLDYYKTLGVSRDADEESIRKAFKSLARQYHPDRNQGDPTAEQRFKDVNEAHRVLGDPTRRSLYDRYGHEGLREGFDPELHERMKAARQQGGAGPFGGGFGGVPFDLGDLFGAMGGGRARQPAREVVLPLTLDFVRAVEGTQVEFTWQRPVSCGVCGGRGVTQAGICGVCRGAGTQERPAALTVKVPAGAADGDRLRLRGKGAIGPDGKAADLVVELRVTPHPVFQRDGLNLEVPVEVTPLDLLTGTEVEVPTLGGTLTMKVPAGVDPNAKLRAAGRGVRRGSKTGDLKVRLVVRPLRLEGEALEQARRLRETLRGGSDGG